MSHFVTLWLTLWKSRTTQHIHVTRRLLATRLLTGCAVCWSERAELGGRQDLWEGSRRRGLQEEGVGVGDAWRGAHAAAPPPTSFRPPPTRQDTRRGTQLHLPKTHKQIKALLLKSQLRTSRIHSLQNFTKKQSRRPSAPASFWKMLERLVDSIRTNSKNKNYS